MAGREPYVECQIYPAGLCATRIPEYNFILMDILTQLKDQRDRIDAAIRALGEDGAGNGRKKAVHSGPTNGRRKKRKLSAAARRKISLAAKARWAKAKKAGKNRL